MATNIFRTILGAARSLPEVGIPPRATPSTTGHAGRASPGALCGVRDSSGGGLQSALAVPVLDPMVSVTSVAQSQVFYEPVKWQWPQSPQKPTACSPPREELPLSSRLPATETVPDAREDPPSNPRTGIASSVLCTLFGISLKIKTIRNS